MVLDSSVCLFCLRMECRFLCKSHTNLNLSAEANETNEIKILKTFSLFQESLI